VHAPAVMIHLLCGAAAYAPGHWPASCLANRASAVTMGIDQDATAWIGSNLGAVEKSSSLGGSGWSSFRRVSVEDDAREYFVKTSNRPSDAMFLGEALGLRAMYSAEAVRIPEVVGWGDGTQGGSFIVMEYLPLSGKRRADPREFGRAMARMHLAPPAAAEARQVRRGDIFE